MNEHCNLSSTCFFLQDGLVNVGWTDCSKQADLCDSFEITTSTTALFPPGSSLAQKGSVMVGTLFINMHPV